MKPLYIAFAGIAIFYAGLVYWGTHRPPSECQEVNKDCEVTTKYMMNKEGDVRIVWVCK